jgi:hypothetical protein
VRLDGDERIFDDGGHLLYKIQPVWERRQRMMLVGDEMKVLLF